MWTDVDTKLTIYFTFFAYVLLSVDWYSVAFFMYFNITIGENYDTCKE